MTVSHIDDFALAGDPECDKMVMDKIIKGFLDWKLKGS